MLGDIRNVEHIYIACGYTDLRRGIDGLAQIVQNQFSLDPCPHWAVTLPSSLFQQAMILSISVDR